MTSTLEFGYDTLVGGPFIHCFGSELEVRELVLVEGVKLRNEHKIRTTRMNSRSTLGLRGKGWGIGIKGRGTQQVGGEG